MADLVSGDTGSKLTVTIKDSSGAVQDVTSGTVKMRYRYEKKRGEWSAPKEVTMTKEDAANGVVSYTFAAADLSVENNDQGAFEADVFWDDGTILTSKNKITLTVRGKVA